MSFYSLSESLQSKAVSFSGERDSMNILHINGGYPFTEIFRELVLNESSCKTNAHTIFVPLRVGRVLDNQIADMQYGKHRIADNVEVIQLLAFRQVDRLLPKHKMKKIAAQIERQVNLSNIDLVHAHHLFSDGGVAYCLKKKFDIDYIVAVRNTDVNLFLKYAVSMRKFGIEIMRAAKKIIFLSPAYLDTVFSKYIPKELRHDLQKKTHVIPNGIQNFWLENKFTRKPQNGNGINLLFVGEVTANKNILTSIEVARALHARGRKVSLRIIGSGSQLKKIKRVATRFPEIISVLGRIDSKQDLLGEYRKANMFIMPSYTETFGLVYGEAMSQGLPVIYTKGEGIDGYFPDGTVGFACNPKDPGEIANAVEKLFDDYEGVSTRAASSVDMFSWKTIAQRYNAIYDSCVAVSKSS